MRQAGIAVAGRRHAHHMLQAQVFIERGHRRGDVVHQAEIGLAALHAVDDGLVGQDLDRDRDALVALAQPLDGLRQEGRGLRRDGGHVDMARVRVGQAVDLALHHPVGAVELLDAVLQALRVRRGHQPLVLALEQAQPGVVLELAQHLAGGRLRHAHQPGRARHRAGDHDRMEYAQLRKAGLVQRLGLGQADG
ncbi:Uncharacterised protein [Bordetella pertussis]|nr:Uncharacterised protein [Bordetella pertussis]